jgi:arylsulfatase A-like enzyme
LKRILHIVRLTGLVCLGLGIPFGLADLARIVIQHPESPLTGPLLIVGALKSVALATAFGFAITLPAMLLWFGWRRGTAGARHELLTAVRFWTFANAFVLMRILGHALPKRLPPSWYTILDAIYLLLAAFIAFILARPFLWLLLRAQRMFSPRVLLAVCAILVPLAALVVGWPHHPVKGRSDARGPNVLLILVDTLRADALGCYGYPRATTPNLDRLARDSALFEEVIAPSPWTIPSIASLFTGVYPHVHGVVNAGIVLSDEFVTLAEMFRAAGYHTGARISNTLVNGTQGYFQGFDDARVVADPFRKLVIERFLERIGVVRHHDLATAEEITDSGIDWLEANGYAPFFLYLHYFDPHFPYYPPPPYLLRFVDAATTARYPDRGWSGATLWNVLHDFRDGRRSDADVLALARATYDGEIAYTDAQIARLLARVKSLGLAENTIIVVTSDHGEQFLEHGSRGHSKTLYQEEIRVPLLIRAPGFGPRRIHHRVRLLDLYPTLWEIAHLAEQPGTRALARRVREQSMGRSLVPWMRGEEPVGDDGEAYCSLDLDGRKKEAYLHGEWKLIENVARKDDVERPAHELYHLSADAAERQDLSNANRTVYEELARRWAEEMRVMKARAVKNPEIDPFKKQWIRQMKALGYVN